MTDKDLSPDGPLAEAGDRAPPRILVVDDDPTSLTLLGEILDPRDFTVIFCTRGQEALKLAREGVDLLLLDYQLPDLDGLEASSSIMWPDKPNHNWPSFSSRPPLVRLIVCTLLAYP